MNDIAAAVRDLKQSIADTAREAGRSGEAIRWVLVTKTVEPARILEAYEAGERDFGENRVQEWTLKKEVLPGDIRWHLIGHLQTNKVKEVIGRVHLIHSLDRPELAGAIEKQAHARQIPEVPCLVQVNLSGEESKYGFPPAGVEAFMRQMPSWPRIKVCGLMTIGPLTENADRIRDCFRGARELFDAMKKKFPKHSWDVLSMGMSGDYPIAVSEGATLLRIGTLVFGGRKR